MSYYRMKTKSFDVIYKNAPRHQVDELLEFRSTHPVQQRSIDGVEWKYILSGTGSETILIMGGPLSTPEMHYRSILNLEQDYRVLSLSYSVFDRIDNFIDGLAKLLDLEGIGRFHLRGTSLGAGICHVLIRRQSLGEIDPLKKRVDKLILSTFGLYSSKKISQLKILIWLFQLLPYWVSSKYINFTMSTWLKKTNQFDLSFNIAHNQDIINYQNNQQTLIGHYQMVVDMFENSNYNLKQEIDSSKILIIETQDEKSLDPSEQNAFRQTYPNAHIHLFESGGHLREITHQDEYPEIIREFLAQPNN
jgi:pimeloyl-ACP methyl ester carboxylesterase